MSYLYDSRIDDLSPNLDSINNIWQNGYLNVLADYKAGIIKKNQILGKFDSIKSIVNDAYVIAYQKDLKDRNINEKLKFYKIVKKAIILEPFIKTSYPLPLF